LKIEIEIPDRYKDRNLWIFAGIEPVAYRAYKKGWKIKISDCSICGKCCMKLDNDRFPFQVLNGVCEHLEKRPGKDERYLCRLNIFRPFGCGIGTKTIPGCTIKFEDAD
jgi:hypothetical protein